MIPLRLLFPVFVLTASITADAAETPETYIDPEKAGPDFAVQGEYVGEPGGAQVIALGNGKFHIVGWANGLPGAADDAEKKKEVDAERVGEKVVFQGDGVRGSIEGDTLKATNDEGRTFIMKKTVRHSSTEGAKPPVGATVLFDGNSAEGWEGGKIDERHLLAGGTKTKQAYGAFTLHAEFRTPFMPSARGQGRGNSGLYLQNRYECQVLDSFGLAGEDNECGGVYHLLKPRLNMCYPPLTWQTYDIDFEPAKFDAAGMKTKNAVVTLKHNGVTIHDHREIKETTGGAGLKETSEPGPILLQNHGNPVFYRNIWIVEKK